MYHKWTLSEFTATLLFSVAFWAAWIFHTKGLWTMVAFSPFLLKPTVNLRCSILKQLLRLFFVALVLSLAPHAQGEILFEGYSTVLLDGVHVGFVVQRFEFDNKKQEFITTYFLKTNQIGGNITESLKARANASLKPVSFQFTELVGEKSRTIDALFKGENMTATIISGGQKQIIQKKIPKGAFLASFLGYVMLQGREGIKKDVKYSYHAIAEEDASLYSGEAYIAGEELVNGISAFKILNTFKSTQFVSFCTYKGEVIATRSPVQKISTELVIGAREATVGLGLNSSTLTHLFGNVPSGAENPVSRRALEPSPTVSPTKDIKETPRPETPKQQGIPGGTGIHLKGKPSEK
jgi:hypothetical protein